MSKARVSVGLPVYNGAKFLSMSIESVLWQSEEDIELVINDNASTDETQRICEEYAARDRRIKYHRSVENVGLAKNWRLVFEYSTGRYFKWHAHDDIMMPAYLELCAEALDKHPDVILVYPRRRLIHYTAAEGTPEQWMAASMPDRVESHAEPDYEYLVKLWGYYAPTFLHGVMRPEALRRTRLLGAYNHSDNVL